MEERQGAKRDSRANGAGEGRASDAIPDAPALRELIFGRMDQDNHCLLAIQRVALELEGMRRKRECQAPQRQDVASEPHRV
eukprot:1709722-Rhodomonas_salina.4